MQASQSMAVLALRLLSYPTHQRHIGGQADYYLGSRVDYTLLSDDLIFCFPRHLDVLYRLLQEDNHYRIID